LFRNEQPINLHEPAQQMIEARGETMLFRSAGYSERLPAPIFFLKEIALLEEAA
jgi:hypothetical protein